MIILQVSGASYVQTDLNGIVSNWGYLNRDPPLEFGDVWGTHGYPSFEHTKTMNVTLW